MRGKIKLLSVLLSIVLLICNISGICVEISAETYVDNTNVNTEKYTELIQAEVLDVKEAIPDTDINEMELQLSDMEAMSVEAMIMETGFVPEETLALETGFAPVEMPASEASSAPIETPVPETSPALTETPAPETSPALTETPAPETSPALTETPAPETSPALTETPAPETSPALTETPAPETSSTLVETTLVPETSFAPIETSYPEESIETSSEIVSLEETSAGVPEETTEEETSAEETTEEETTEEETTEEETTEEEIIEEETTEEETTEEETEIDEEESTLEEAVQEFDANASVQISSCVISGGNIQITAVAGTSGKLYLFNLETYEDISSFSGKKAITNKSVTANVTFTVSIPYKQEYLTDKFVFGSSSQGNCVSNARYITNPEAVASTSQLHSASGKKGLMVYATDTLVQDAANLGVKYSTITIEMNTLLNSNGTINYSGIASAKNHAALLANRGIVVYAILVLPVNAPSLLKNAGAAGGSFYAAWNTDHGGAEMYESLMIQLTSSLSSVVSHWIIGNEVNDNIQWNYMGPASIQTHVQEYAKTFRLCYNAIKSVNAAANVYISMDHRWNQNANTTQKYDTKAYLNYFDQYISSFGNIDWCLAFHAYSIPLGAPEIWDDGQAVYSYNGQLLAGGGEISFDENTFAITMKNIDVLTSYFCNRVSRNTKGAVRTIALTEQGWTSYSERTNADASMQQATSIAYAYNKAVSNPYIECLIVSRQVDAFEMGNNYYKFGIKNESFQNKYSYEVFKNLGTSASLYTSAALPVVTKGTGKVSGTLRSSVTISGAWKSSYNTSVSGSQATLSNAASTDKVIAMQTGGYNASAVPYFGVTVNIVPAGSNNAVTVMLRVYSGEKIIEAEAVNVAVGKSQDLVFDLTGWAGISNVTGVELWIRGMHTTGQMSVSALSASSTPETGNASVTSVGDIAWVKTSTEANGIRISWAAVKNAKWYGVYRKTATGKWQWVSFVPVGTTTYLDTGCARGTVYQYVVRGLVKYPSVVFGGCKMTAAAILLDSVTVTEFHANTSSSISINWSASAGASGYRIFRKAYGSNTWTVLGNQLATAPCSFTDNSCSPGTIYYYAVRAYRKLNSSFYTWSNFQRLLTKTLTSAPTLTSAVQTGSGAVTIGWSQSKGASGYAIMRKTWNSGWTWIKTVPATTLQFTDTTAKAGYTYTYTVRSYHWYGTSLVWGYYYKNGISCNAVY